MTTHFHLLPFVLCLFAFVQGEGARQIVPEEFIKARPAKSTATTAKGPSYRPAAPQPAAARKNSGAKASEMTQLGLTIWRLRPAKAADTGARIIVQESDETAEWTPERVEANTPLRVGERIRISIESPRTGYLYVIDREQYADGTLSEPYLIFPTTRTRGGDNRVTAGRVIEIPGQGDRPNYFRLQQSRPNQIAEMMTVLVTMQPLEGLTIGPQPLVLAKEQVAKWEKDWSAPAERFELVGGAGKTWTPAEQAAGADGTRLLTQEDPSPQTIYRVATKPGEPMLIKVPLRYSRPPTQTRKSK